MFSFHLLMIVHLFTESALAQAPSDLGQACRSELASLPGHLASDRVKLICESVKQLGGCASQKGQPIYHFSKDSSGEGGRRILAISLIHGDERPAGMVTRSWMERLTRIEPRNHWRVIPVANPDGFSANQRINSRGVDLNRNFPTKEWGATALKAWKERTKSDPRRYPGPEAGSESETQCLLRHIDDFKPDFIISVHTPIGVLDFDGPRVNVPELSPLPWSPLGNFPGSLGRYMWKDRNIPVLTIELKGNAGVKKLEELDRLQDISGTIAIDATKARLEGVD